MGVPKFFRYISERYPNLSELIGSAEVNFDAFYFLIFFTLKNLEIDASHTLPPRGVYNVWRNRNVWRDSFYLFVFIYSYLISTTCT